MTYHPALATIIGVALFAIPLLYFVSFFGRITDRGEPFAVYRNQIAVTSSELKFGERKSGPTVAVIGIMKNNSDIDWEDVHLEVRFYDGEGQMVDAGHTEKFVMVLPAKSEKSFKFSLPREFAEEQYVSCKMSVTWAKEAGTF